MELDEEQHERLRRITDKFENTALWTPLSEIEPDLYLGGIPQPQDGKPEYLYRHSPHIYVDNLGVRTIISITDYPINWVFPEGVEHHSIVMPDAPNSNIENHFAYVAEVIEMSRSRGAKVMVHCHMGISRSATLLIAYLYLKRRHDPRYATIEAIIEHVVSKRPIVRPNFGFLKKLLMLEKYD